MPAAMLTVRVLPVSRWQLGWLGRVGLDNSAAVAAVGWRPQSEPQHRPASLDHPATSIVANAALWERLRPAGRRRWEATFCNARHAALNRSRIAAAVTGIAPPAKALPPALGRDHELLEAAAEQQSKSGKQQHPAKDGRNDLRRASAETPAIMVIPVEMVEDTYLRWIMAETDHAAMA